MRNGEQQRDSVPFEPELAARAQREDELADGDHATASRAPATKASTVSCDMRTRVVHRLPESAREQRRARRAARFDRQSAKQRRQQREAYELRRGRHEDRHVPGPVARKEARAHHAAEDAEHAAHLVGIQGQSLLFAPRVADDPGDAAQHHQRVAEPGEQATGDQHFVRSAEREAQDAGRDRNRSDDQRTAQVMRDQQAGRNIGDQPREAEGARERAERKVIDAGGAPDIRQQHRKRADRERVAEDEQAEKDDRPCHGSRASEGHRPGTGMFVDKAGKPQPIDQRRWSRRGLVK